MLQKFDFNDILLVPEVLTDIDSRKEVNPFINETLPLITAPMDTVIDRPHIASFGHFEKTSRFIHNKLNICLPRGIDDEMVDFVKGVKCSVGSKNLIFESMSLQEFIATDFESGKIHYVCIDIANGHMKSLVQAIKTRKKMYGDFLHLMVGNIGNPETFKVLAEAGATYVRVGIGNGGGCLTTKQLGIGYPMGSLIHETYLIKKENNLQCKIVADGGMKSYSDVIKALALGADFVMVGGIMNKALESSPIPYLFGWMPIRSYDVSKFLMKLKLPLYKKFRGMSTKEVQKKWGREELKTAEGIVTVNKVEYTLDGWAKNMEDYLRSAMSYTNSRTLEEFKGSEFIHITDKAYRRFDK